MTYNLLGLAHEPEVVIATIQRARPDLVALQEVNPTVAAAVTPLLAGDYPYQVLDPREMYAGMGFLSRLPARMAAEQLPLEWVGVPQAIEVDLSGWQSGRDLGGESVLVLNVHAFPSIPASPHAMDRVIRLREEQARAVADYAARWPGPRIVLGDFNTTEHTAAYRILRRDLEDAWVAAGWGFGRTWLLPARPRLPLFRIDYILHSAHFRATHAEVAPWDGFSAHLAVIARLSIAACGFRNADCGSK